MIVESFKLEPGDQLNVYGPLAPVIVGVSKTQGALSPQITWSMPASTIGLGNTVTKTESIALLLPLTSVT